MPLARRLVAFALVVTVVGASLAGCRPGAQVVDGVLVDVRSQSLSQVDGMSLRDDTGKVWRFEAGGGAGRGDHAMTPGHLRQHMALGDRVRVRYRQEGDRLIAEGLDDL